MLTVIRKNQQVLMLLIAIMTIVAFIWLYNRTNLDKVGSNDVATVYGRVVQKAEIDHEVRGYRLALALGLTDFVRDLGGMGADEQVSLSDYVLNLMIVRHQAPELGVLPSDDSVAAAMKGLAVFQTDGTFDPAKYTTFLRDQLTPNGFTERQLEGIVRDSLHVAALRRIITSPVAVGETQVREAARIYQPVTGQMIRFDRDAYAKDINIPQEEVTAFYAKNRDGLVSREARDISYASVDLPPAQQKLEGKERTSALQKLADQAVAAGNALRAEATKGIDFAKAAEKAALHPKKAAAVERDGTREGKETGVPAQVVAGAFRLQKSGEISDIIQDGDSFYIVTVEGITPAKQLALAEVADRITVLLRQEKATKALAEGANKSLEEIKSAIASGKSFAEAAKQVGVKTQQITGAVPSDTKAPQEQAAFASATLGLKEGEISTLQPAPWGAFAAWLEKRIPLTDAQWREHQADLSKTILANERELLFLEWLRSSRTAAKVSMINSGGNR